MKRVPRNEPAEALARLRLRALSPPSLTALVMLVGLVALVSLAFVDRRQAALRSPVAAAPPPSYATLLSVNAIVASPGMYIGRRVTLSALVEARIGSGSLVITTRYVPDHHDLLVVGASPMAVPSAARPGDAVQVRGTVSRLERAHWSLAGDAPTSTLEAWTGRPVILADSVVPLP